MLKAIGTLIFVPIFLSYGAIERFYLRRVAPEDLKNEIMDLNIAKAFVFVKVFDSIDDDSHTGK